MSFEKKQIQFLLVFPIAWSFLLRVLDLGKRATQIRFAPRRPLKSNVRSGGLFRNMQANRALSSAGWNQQSKCNRAAGRDLVQAAEQPNQHDHRERQSDQPKQESARHTNLHGVAAK